MTALMIRWWRDSRYPDTVAHATVPILTTHPPQARGLDPAAVSLIAGSLSPVCMGSNGSISDERARWVVSPYAARCQACLNALTQALEDAITVPTAPVPIRFTIDVVVDPSEVDHARGLMQSYVTRTKTFNRHEVPVVMAVVRPE